MITASLAYSPRRALNPILTDRVIYDEESGRTPFLTPTALRIERWRPLIVAGGAGICLGIAWIASRMNIPAPVAHLALLIAFVTAGIPGLRSAWQSLLEKRLDIDVLMILGAALAAAIGQPTEGAILLFLFALSGALEQEAMRRTQSAIASLHRLNPSEAIVLDEAGGQQRMATRSVPIGARIIVRPGDKVPLDGMVIEGESAVDESPITGESMPRTRTLNDPVFAGTINGGGRLTVRVTKVAGETQLAKIIRLVTEARGQKAKVQRLLDRIGPAYTMCVISAALLVAILTPSLLSIGWQQGLYRAITLLIVASPCALIIATPIAYLSAIAAAARHGVMVKGGAYLEVLARCRSAVFDKTGTLTVGQPKLCDLLTFDGVSPESALQAAGALEASSSHPLASAIARALEERHLTPACASEVEMIPGHGLRGRIDGVSMTLGRPEFVADLLDPASRKLAAEAVERLRADGRTVALLSHGGKPVVLSFEDPIRPDAAETIQALREQGIGNLQMLTGDHRKVADRVAAMLGLDEAHADLLPEDKLRLAEKLGRDNGPVLMVGDGVNDAPVLARVDVGIALASIGADAALEAAPIVIVSNQLHSVAWITGHARRTAGVVRQNLTLAISVIVVLSILAVAGQVHLPLAVIAHEGSTLLVAVNALRLLRPGVSTARE